MNIIAILNYLHWSAGIILLFLAVVSYRNINTNLARHTFSLMLLMSAWAFSVAFINLIPSLELKILLNRIKLCAAIYIPLSIFFIGASFNNLQFKKLTLFMLALIPLASTLIVLSPLHELFIGSYETKTIYGRDILTFVDGPLFIFHFLWARFLVIGGLVLILWGHKSQQMFYRAHTWPFVLAIMIPFLLDTIAVERYPVMRFLQVVPISFSLSGAIFVYLLIRKRNLEFAPFASSQVVSQLKDPCLMWDQHSLLADFNQAAGKLFQLSHADIARRHYRDFAFHDCQEFCSNDGRFFNITHEEVVLKKKPAGHFTLFSEITGQKKVEQELRSLNEVRATILNILSHDLAGNVSTIHLHSEVLRQNHANLTPHEISYISEAIYQSSETVNNFIRDLLDWSRSHHGQMTLKREICHLNELVQGVIAYLRPLSVLKEHRIEIDIDPKVHIMTDIQLLETIVRNILSNAIKFSAANEVIKVRYREREERPLLIIQNFGRSWEVNGVNEFFGQTTLRSARTPASIGLGLHLCRELINLQGGKIWAESSPSDGTQFYIELSSS